MPASPKPDRLSQRETEYAGAIRTEREAHAELLGPLRDGVRHRAIESDRGEDDREGREHADEQQVETIGAKRAARPAAPWWRC